MYEAVMAESVRLWKSAGTPQAAIEYVQAQLAREQPDVELQGRLTGLLSKWVKRVGTPSALRRAMKLQTEALDELTTPAFIADGLCNLVDLCVDLHKVELGIMYSARMLQMLEAAIDGVGTWEAPFLHNYGRLLALAGDHQAAVPRLQRARDLFRAGEQVPEAACVGVALASSMLELGRHDEAEELCRQVKVECDHERILVEANMLLSRMAMLSGDLPEAGRLLESAITKASEAVGTADFRVVVRLLQAEAELDRARGDLATARRLQLLAQTWAAAGRTDL